ncbi:MAG: hypothetical protein JXR12_05760 [Neptunomonas phycophila]|uniref:hypothetical protein n=1 Tax=Neptunomonas phycophila TaxID=1572645 RepID=UPI003B8DB7EF
MLAYRGTDWLYQFDINPIEDDLYEIEEYDGTITEIEHSEYGLGLYFYANIEETDEYQYSASASIETDVVDFDLSEFNTDSDSVEGSVYRLLDTHNANDNKINRARYFKTCIDIVLNTDVKAINVNGTVVVYDLSTIKWETINVNEQVLCVPYDPFK